jgi:dienelactone hydrolase
MVGEGRPSTAWTPQEQAWMVAPRATMTIEPRWLGFVLFAAILALLLSHREASAQETYRVLSPSGSARHPAVLLVPGCSGFAASNGVNLYEERATELQAAGYVVVFVDFVGRRSLTNCGHVSRAEVGQDILEAAAWIRGQEGVDADRISAIGWSYGGGGILAALTAMPAGSPLIAKAAMYYPDCRGARPWSASGVSALILIGANDDVAVPALCDKANGPSLRTIVYPNAYHAFDSRRLPQRAEYPFGTLGYDAEAAKASWAAVLDFIR